MKIKYIIWLAALVLITSCKNGLDGECGYPIFKGYFPGLVLESQAQSTVVNTDNYFWWKTTEITDDSGGGGAIVMPGSPDKIEYDWITVEKADDIDDHDSKALKITVGENTTGKDRQVEIELSFANCFDSFTVTQKAAAE
jgi:hypothetical protein